jgi:hypothetical protein
MYWQNLRFALRHAILPCIMLYFHFSFQTARGIIETWDLPDSTNHRVRPKGMFDARFAESCFTHPLAVVLLRTEALGIRTQHENPLC